MHNHISENTGLVIAKKKLLILALALFAWANTGPTWAIDPIFGERWETATIRSHTPTEDTVFLEADAGTWWLGDTVANFPECGETPHRATISMINGSKALTLVSENSNSHCADNIWVTFQELGPYNPGFAIPVTSDTLISFDATGVLVNPQSGRDTCLGRPCGDTISLTLQILPSGSELSYILQRAPDAVPNTRHDFYREIFLDPNTGSYQRNLMNDLMSIPNFNPSGAQVKFIEFAVDEHGSATLDNLVIGIGQQAPVSINSFTATPASIQEGETTTLNWTVSNATSCTALNGNSDWQAVTPGIAGGTANITLSTVGNFTFTLQCTDGVNTVSSDTGVSAHQLQLTKMNVGLNDAWFNPATDGQGFYINVFPEIGYVALSWFTYDTVRPVDGVVSNLGEPGHRWLIALGEISGNRAVMDVSYATGGLFDSTTPTTETYDGTITLTFTDCNSGTVEYDIPSIDQQGTVPIERIVSDNIALCEFMAEQASSQQESTSQKVDGSKFLSFDDPINKVEALPLVDMNAGLNDAWFNPATDGQGFYINVFPEIGYVALSWFTYDTMRPVDGVASNLGEPGQRWLIALGEISGNRAVMDVSYATGGLFDSTTPTTEVYDGTITLTFTGCNSGTVEYDIPSINQQGTVPIERIVSDNIALCEALISE